MIDKLEALNRNLQLALEEIDRNTSISKGMICVAITKVENLINEQVENE